MRAGQAIAAAFWLAFALGTIYAGRNLGLGSLHDPGSGFMIFWVGVAMAVLSLATLIASARQPAGEALGALWTGLRWRVIPYVTVLLVLYALLLPVLGFPLVTVLLMLLLFKTVEQQNWVVAIGGALASAGAAYLVFGRWLGTQLPSGTIWEMFS